MKTFYKRPLSDGRAREVQARLEARTGVKWDFYSVRGGTRFTAVATVKTAHIDRAAGQALLPHLTRDRRAFADIHDASNLPFRIIVDGAWTLAAEGMAAWDTNRLGNMAAVGLK